MTLPKKRHAVWLIVPLSIGGIAAMHMIVPNAGSHTCDHIEIGMTLEQVKEIVESKTRTDSQAADLQYSWNPEEGGIYNCCWQDGSAVSVSFGRDECVNHPPIVRESQETAWQKINRRVKNAGLDWLNWL
jgi:hypothetical protein